MKRSSFGFQKLITFVLVYAFALPMFVLGGNPPAETRSLTENQKIIHVLNRLGFGARPGDVEKVRAIGVNKYIEQQLNRTAIDDAAVEARVKNLEVFQMSTAQVFAKYPNPGALLRQLEGGRQAQAEAQPSPADKTGKMPEEQLQNGRTPAEQRERQQKLQKLYREHDLRPANQLMPQIAANRILRAAYSERQLQEVMVDFWQNHFNVFSGKAAVRWYIPSYERDVLRKNALGNFKDLVVGTAQHPAMLFFLDNFESRAPKSQAAANNRLARQLQNGTLNPRQRERIKQRQGLTDAELDQRIKRMQNLGQRERGLNENYARELMELHTLGVDGGYSQKDIVEVARAFTGWTIADPRGYRRAAAATIQGTDDRRMGRLQRLAGVPDDTESGEFYFNDGWHDKDAKTVLGEKVAEGGVNDGLKVIDILVKHPSTAKFIARKLAVKFVSDNPSEALVDRVAGAFRRSNGDIKTTLSALFKDKEFFAPENYRAKIKTPFELAVSSIRALGAETNGGPAMLAMLNKLGEVPYGYQAPTGYPDTAEDWVNTGALLERLNFAVAISSNRIPGTRVDLKRFGSTDRSKILDAAIGQILDNDISATTRSTLLKQVDQPLPEVKPGVESQDVADMSNAGPQGRRGDRPARLLAPSGNPEVFKVVSLVLGTPEFQRQ